MTRLGRLLIAGLLSCARPPDATLGPGAAPSPAAKATPSPTVTVRVLAFNDFHGHLKPPDGRVPGVAGPVGGAAYVAAHLKRLGAEQPNTVVVAAGDLVGGSPLTSALFHDEPTILAMNAMKLSILGLGNHELDEGLSEVLRLRRGGCHPKDGCALHPTFDGARFDFVAANVEDEATGRRVLPAYVLRTFEGIPVAFVGMPLEGTPRVAAPGGVKGLLFRDEVRTVRALIPELTKQGVAAIVVLLHEGGLVKGGGLNDCRDLHGPVVAIAEKADPAVDVFITGHTHALYNCRVGGRPVTSALSFGRVITEVNLVLDRRTKDVVEATAHNHAVTHDLAPDPVVGAIVDHASRLAAPKEDRVVGRIAGTLRASASGTGEATLGTVVADAHLEATRKAGAQLALTNVGGLRTDLTFARSRGEPVDGLVTYGEAFAAQPFGNVLVTLAVSGGELIDVLEDELRRGTIPQSSSNVRIRIAGRRLRELLVDGSPVHASDRVSVTVNSFMAETVPAFRRSKERVVGAEDLEALEAYFRAHPVVAVPVTKRVEREPAVDAGDE